MISLSRVDFLPSNELTGEKKIQGLKTFTVLCRALRLIVIEKNQLKAYYTEVLQKVHNILYGKA